VDRFSKFFQQLIGEEIISMIREITYLTWL